MKVLYSGFRDPAHSLYGGYDKITDIDLDKKILLSENYPFGHSNFKSHLMRLPFTLLDIHTRILRSRFDITHLFYGEITMLFFLPYFKIKKSKTVITLHLDIEKRRFPSLFIRLLRYFDGIIVLSTQQQDYLWNKYKIKSKFIPHGFYKPEFTPTLPLDTRGQQMRDDKINILTVGNNYRDFETLQWIIEAFKDNGKFKFHLVGMPSKVKEQFQNFNNVSIYNRLDNDEFYTIISQADYGFLPLTFATANNTLLEYQFLNLPTVLPNIPGVLDYAAPAPLNLFYDNRQDLYKIIKSLPKSTKSNNLSYFVQRYFEWNNIFKKVKEYYKELMESRNSD